MEAATRHMYEMLVEEKRGRERTMPRINSRSRLEPFGTLHLKSVPEVRARRLCRVVVYRFIRLAWQ